MELAGKLGLPDHVLFAKGIQIACVEYSRGTFLQLSSKCSIEIVHGLLEINFLSVVVYKLVKLQASVPNASIVKWKRLSTEPTIFAASWLLQHEPMRLLREDQGGLSLILR